MKKPKLYFISDSVPNTNSFGSEVIFFRHLTDLTENYRLILYTSKKHFKVKGFKNEELNCKVKFFIVDSFLPLYFLKRFRGIANSMYSLEFIIREGFRTKLILSYLWDVRLSVAAAAIAKFTHSKLFYFLHDDPFRFSAPQNEKYLKRLYAYCVEKSNLFLTVTESLAHNISKKLDINLKYEVLLPIPEGIIFKRNNAFTKRLIFSGSLISSTRKLLQKIIKEINWPSLIISHNISEEEDLNFKITKPIKSNKAALEFIKSEDGVILIPYPEISEENEWMTSSFPSKLIEYSYLQMPLILITPKKTAFYEWIYSRTSLPIFEPNDLAGISHYINSLTHIPTLDHNIEEVEKLRTKYLSKEIIGKKLLNILQK